MYDFFHLMSISSALKKMLKQEKSEIYFTFVFVDIFIVFIVHVCMVNGSILRRAKHLQLKIQKS